MRKAIVRCEGRATVRTLLSIRSAMPRLALQDLRVDIRLPAATNAQLAHLKRELGKLKGRASLKA
jgi:hypothetical protein